MSVNWCANVVMKEEREMNCGASNGGGGRRERGEGSKQTRLDGKGREGIEVTSSLLQALDIIAFQIEYVHHAKAKIPNLQ